MVMRLHQSHDLPFSIVEFDAMEISDTTPVKVSTITKADVIELDCGSGEPDFVPCVVLNIEHQKSLFDNNVVKFYVKPMGEKAFWTVGFAPTDSINLIRKNS